MRGQLDYTCAQALVCVPSDKEGSDSVLERELAVDHSRDRQRLAELDLEGMDVGALGAGQIGLAVLRRLKRSM